MKPMIVKPGETITGRLILPGDKSISHRAIMIGAISRGKTVVKDLLDCDDCNYTIGAFRDMGIPIKRQGAYTTIDGSGLRGLKPPGGHLNLGNSGTSMRLLAGILAGQNFSATLDADRYLSVRPMQRITEPLSLMGVDIKSSSKGYPPLVINGGRVKAIDYKMPIPSAQIKSAILLAGLYADGNTVVEEASKSRDHTERMLKYFGAELAVSGLKVSVKGGSELDGRTVEVPGDISSASFFIAGAILLKGSKLRIEGAGINPTRAGILDILVRMGANIKVVNRKDLFEPAGDIECEYARTRGISIARSEIPGIIDELPVIFVLASLSDGRTVIKGADELKVKETDRIKSMISNLSLMGAKIRGENGAIVIDGVEILKGSDGLKSYGDHRTCMAMTIAALTAKGSSRIDDAECVSKSFPDFFSVLAALK
ncbi:MAG: 3-phosphoshikimate 1-carboxyvinyltransferase [Candidatus Omnitrophota bacterium]|nr:3-phosphoshikimate 1-carboxyvinyltransferase [Candidatus Omnitrophota bacterium]